MYSFILGLHTHTIPAVEQTFTFPEFRQERCDQACDYADDPTAELCARAGHGGEVEVESELCGRGQGAGERAGGVGWRGCTLKIELLSGL